MSAMRGQMVEAVFTPRNRSELQGDGTSTGGGLFQCIGQCGESLNLAGTEYSYCTSGSWTSGSGTCTTYADMDVPPGQGDGTHGAIGSWDVSNVKSMNRSECRTTTDIPVFVISSLILTYCIFPSLSHILILHHQSFIMRTSSNNRSQGCVHTR